MIIKTSYTEYNPDDYLEIKEDDDGTLALEITNVFDEHVELYVDKNSAAVNLKREQAEELLKVLQEYLGKSH